MSTSKNVVKVVSNEAKKVLNLNEAKNKDIVLKAKKEAIKEGTKFNLKDIDFLNLKNETIKLKVEKTKKSTTKNFLYKFERLNLGEAKEKSLRKKFRTILNNHVDNCLYHFNNDDESNLILSIEEFKKYYLETYILNDYSISSMCANNTDKEKIKKVSLFLKVFNLINS